MAATIIMAIIATNGSNARKKINKKNDPFAAPIRGRAALQASPNEAPSSAMCGNMKSCITTSMAQATRHTMTNIPINGKNTMKKLPTSNSPPD